VTLPFDRRLVVYSNILIVLLFTFYTIFYVTIYINNFTNLGTPTNTQVSFYGGIFSIAIVTIGAILMIRTRNGLSMLSSKEVIYSINKVHVSSGIYKYFHHPMYIGMLLIVIGTLVLNPSIIGSIVISFIAICLVLKARTEIKK
jgi:protein-S-isoprenylcysteine O-methyltransferase Ste14